MELEIAGELYYEEMGQNLANNIWTMRDGSEIKLEDMEISHIQNCINMLIYNNHLFKDAWLKKFQEELDFRYMVGE